MRHVTTLNTRSLFLVCVVLLILSVLSFSFALHRSPSSVLTQRNSSYDIRLNGVSRSGWIQKDFSFREQSLFAPSVRTRLTFDKRSSARQAIINLFINGREIGPVTITGAEPIYVSLPVREIPSVLSEGESGFLLEGKCINPVSDGTPEGGTVCARLTSITLQPRFFSMLPSPGFALAPLAVIFITLAVITLATFSPGGRTFSLLPAVVSAALISMSLAGNRFAYWNRGFWACLFFALIFAGFILCRLIGRQEEKPEDGERPGGGDFVWPLLILIIGTYVRFDGLDFGLPAYFHPDEGRKMQIIRRIAETGDLDPNYFRHPTFLLYGGAFLTWIFSLIAGYVPDLPSVAYLGRCVSAILGSLSVLLVYLITRSIYGKFAARFAALLFALSPLHVVSSHYIKEDAAMLFYCLASLYFALKSLQSRNKLLFICLSALFAGFSASSKYSGMLTLIFASVPVGNLIFLRLAEFQPLRFFRELSIPQGDFGRNPLQIAGLALLVPALAAIGFLIFTPYSILNSEKFIFDFTGEKQHMERGHSVAISALSHYWSYHLRYSILPAIRPVGALLSIVAVGFLLYRRRVLDLLIVASVMLFYLPAEWVNAKPEPQPERYIVPCVPFLCMALGALLSAINSRIPRKGLSLPGIITAVAIFASLSASALYTAELLRHMKNDTREQATEWLVSNIPAGSKLIIDWKFYAPSLIDQKFDVIELKARCDPKNPDGKENCGDKILSGLSTKRLRATGADYFVASSFFFGRYVNPLYRSHNLSKRYKAVFDELQPVAVFDAGPYRYGFHNPTIYILPLK